MSVIESLRLRDQLLQLKDDRPFTRPARLLEVSLICITRDIILLLLAATPFIAYGCFLALLMDLAIYTYLFILNTQTFPTPRQSFFLNPFIGRVCLGTTVALSATLCCLSNSQIMEMLFVLYLLSRTGAWLYAIQNVRHFAVETQEPIPARLLLASQWLTALILLIWMSIIAYFVSLGINPSERAGVFILTTITLISLAGSLCTLIATQTLTRAGQEPDHP
jgi:hypothetical protein